MTVHEILSQLKHAHGLLCQIADQEKLTDLRTHTVFQIANATGRLDLAISAVESDIRHVAEIDKATRPATTKPFVVREVPEPPDAA